VASGKLRDTYSKTARPDVTSTTNKLRLTIVIPRADRVSKTVGRVLGTLPYWEGDFIAKNFIANFREAIRVATASATASATAKSEAANAAYVAKFTERYNARMAKRAVVAANSVRARMDRIYARRIEVANRRADRAYDRRVAAQESRE
jgi:hypothetical protein